MLPFIITFFIVGAWKTKQYSQLNFAMFAFVIVIAYYLIFTHFLDLAVLIAQQTINKGIFTFHILRPSTNYWPKEIQYVPPSQSFLPWFYEAYSYVVILILSIFTLFHRLVVYLKTRNNLPLDFILISISVSVIYFAIGSALGTLTTGLSEELLLILFGPLLAVYSITQLNSLVHGNKVLYVLVGAMIIFGAFSVVHYEFLDESSEILNVSKSNIATSEWIGDSVDANEKVCSDFNYLSTYLTIEGPTPMTYMPLGLESIKEVFYEGDIKELENQNVGYFVITQEMKSSEVFLFEGSPTKAVINLEKQLSTDPYTNKVYSNNDAVYQIK